MSENHRMPLKPDKKVPALYGGIVMGLISAIPFLNIVNCLCCAGILLGGFLAVMFYKNNFQPKADQLMADTLDTTPFTAGDCLAVGALAGVVGAVVDTLLSIIFIALFGNVVQEFLLNLIQNMDLQIPEEFLQQVEESLREEMGAFGILKNLLLSMVIDPLFGLLGGLIGYSIFKPKQPPAVAPPPPTPQSI